MNTRRTARAVMVAAVCIILLMGLTPAVLADFGPKPSIDIIVKNPPEGEYILDLLVDYEGNFKNLEYSGGDGVDPQVLEILTSYSESGWYPALAHGTETPLFGNLTGAEQSDGSMLHAFSYHGTPDRYRVIIVTWDLRVLVSDVLERKVFADTVTVDFTAADFEAGTITASSLTGTAGGVISVYARQLALTLSATLVIEGLLLLAFGLSNRRNWKVFLIVNVATQLALTIATGSALIYAGAMAAMLAYILSEIVILIAEVIACGRLLSGKTRARRRGYALAANVASAAAGWAFMLLSGLWPW